MRLLRVVAHDVNALTAQDVAAIVGIEFDGFLSHHRQIAGLIVRRKEFLLVVALVHVLPPTSVRRFHENRELQIVEHFVPVDPAHVAE